MWCWDTDLSLLKFRLIILQKFSSLFSVVCVNPYNKKRILIWVSCLISPLPFLKLLSLFCVHTPKQKQVHYPLKILQMYIPINFNNLLPPVKPYILELS